MMLSARVSFMSERSSTRRPLFCALVQAGLPQTTVLTFRRLVARARSTVYTEENTTEAFASTGIHPLNPRRVLGKQNLNRAVNH